jgi:hypothetical protein
LAAKAQKIGLKHRQGIATVATPRTLFALASSARGRETRFGRPAFPRAPAYGARITRLDRTNGGGKPHWGLHSDPGGTPEPGP